MKIVDKQFMLGILGGMGPMAGVELQKKIIAVSPAKKDQEHMKMVCFTNPHINDRTTCLKNGDDFSFSIANSLNQLKSFGARLGVITCNTAHAQLEQIKTQSDLTLVNMVEETVSYIKENFSTVKRIGLLATDGTIQSSVYRKNFQKYGFKEVLPDLETQQVVMDLIYCQSGIKSGFIDSRINFFVLKSLIDDLFSQGAEVVVLGCTELSLFKIANDCVVDPLEVVAKKIVQMVYLEK